ncbi:MAG TPA: OmpH family outer membrane protein [Pyrinomonadaceae bacterium]|jgi:Skp family chaperone for outer membrane proteins
MKVFRLVLAALIFGSLTVAVHAQTRALTNNASKPSNLSASPAPPSGIAIIDSGDFTDPKTGIQRVVAALGQLDVKNQGLNKELKDMQTRLQNLRADIQNKRLVQDPKITAQQTDQADKLELELKRRAEDAQAASDKDTQSALGPLQQDIQNALGAYAKAHGIFLVIDAGRVPLVYADDSIDITKDFITDYNKTHPAAGPAAPAKKP